MDLVLRKVLRAMPPYRRSKEMKISMFNQIRASLIAFSSSVQAGGKGSKLLIFAAVAAMSCFATGFAPTVQAQQLTYANHLSPNHPVNIALKSYFNDVTKATHGELTFQMFPGGEMGGGRALLGLVRSDIVDSAFVNALYSQSALDVENMVGQLLHPNPLVLAGAQNEMFLLHCPQCKAELAENNVLPMMYYSTATYYLMCTKPVSTLNEAKGTKVRSVGSFGRLAAKLGMAPVNMTSDETYQALQRHQLDCVLGSLDWLKSYSLNDIVTDITNLPVGAIGGLMQLGINQSSWNSLSSANKKALEKNLAETIANIEFGYMQGSKRALEKAKAKGIKLVPAGSALKTRLAQFNEAAVKRAISVGKHAGVKDASAIIHEYLKLVAKWEKIVADSGHSRKAYEQALNREIFSKLH